MIRTTGYVRTIDMISDIIRAQIVRNIDTEREDTIEELREIFSYPYHADTGALIFRLEVDRGAFGINLVAADRDGGYIRVNSLGESLYATRFNRFGFGWSAFANCGIEVDEIGRLQQAGRFATRHLYEWFTDRFAEAGGLDFPIACVLTKHEASRGWHLQQRTWTTRYSG
ncbi:hypothetical protein AB0L34_09595 [Micromonospora sp. NPDC052213]|uniref:hypothetical protein n=1 Tax=Micromonospora sp. NPDC052213 TaxID=3155812 RepID=UPI003427DB90